MINTKVRDIPFSPPDITDAEIEEVIKAMKSGWITTGPRTKEFERKIAEFVGVNKAACLNSATAAMELTLRVLGIGPGDEVITSAYTYTASASIIDHVRAKIVLVDTAPDSFEMDYEQLADAITEKTKMIIPVDIGGKMCDYDAIYNVVESKKELFKANNELQALFNRVIVMADAAHAFGATRKGLNCGQVADFTCFSFHAVKNVTTAEGGAVVWRNDLGLDDDEIYKQFMLFSLHGQSKDALAKTQKGAWEYDIVYPAYKCNMTDILAGFGLIQLSRYEGLMARRRELIEMYDKALRPLGIETLEHYGENFSSTGHLYLARIPGISEAERNEIIIKMAEAGIACNVHYKPLPMFTAYKNLGFNIKDYPNAFDMYKNEITLPLHTLLSNEDVEYVVEGLKNAIGEVLSREVAASQSGDLQMPEILIRPIVADDIPDKVRWYNDEEVTRFLHYEEKFTIDGSLKWLQKVMTDKTRFENVIQVKEEECIRNVGIIGLFSLDHKNKKAGFYITIGEKAYQGRGIAQRATIEFLKLSFLKFDLEKVYLYTDVGNNAAQRLYEKVGFNKEGLLRRELLYKNQFIDRYYFGMLREEYFELYPIVGD